MTEEINPSELGAFTNNLPNKEGIKKLIKAVEDNASDIATKQDKLTAGSNVAISDQNVISATDTKYTAGDNVQISEQNVISATDTKYTAGTGITISEQNVISASGDGDDYEWVSINSISGETFSELFYQTSSGYYYKCRYDFIISIQPDRSDISSGGYGDNSIFTIFVPKDSNCLFESYRILAEWFKVGTSPSTNNIMYSTLIKLRRSGSNNELRVVKNVSTITATIVDGNIVFTKTSGSDTTISADFWFKKPVALTP